MWFAFFWRRLSEHSWPEFHLRCIRLRLRSTQSVPAFWRINLPPIDIPPMTPVQNARTLPLTKAFALPRRVTGWIFLIPSGIEGAWWAIWRPLGITYRPVGRASGGGKKVRQTKQSLGIPRRNPDLPGLENPGLITVGPHLSAHADFCGSAQKYFAAMRQRFGAVQRGAGLNSARDRKKLNRANS